MSEPRWFKSSYSADQGNCVEVAYLSGGRFGVRDSKNLDGSALTFPNASWAAFLASVSAGEFEA
ncbi:DUF397 domain-containing protein [Nocardia sp. NPDC050697]|uniref:DUF397 domain-containing protein n=1 Tax=Nocardia sp. NPDC050697 TaxID=3155158 RepID=UPI00340F6ECE